MINLDKTTTFHLRDPRTAYPCYAASSTRCLHLLSSESELGGAGAFENDKLALEEDVTEDGKTDTAVGLETTEALGAGDAAIVHVGAGNGELGATDDGGEAGEGGGAREDVTALGAAVGGTGDLGVVGVDDGVVEEEEGGAGVSDGVDGLGDGGAGADGVAVSGEAPVAFAAVGVDVGDAAGVLGAVDEAKVV